MQSKSPQRQSRRMLFFRRICLGPTRAVIGDVRDLAVGVREINRALVRRTVL